MVVLVVVAVVFRPETNTPTFGGDRHGDDDDDVNGDEYFSISRRERIAPKHCVCTTHVQLLLYFLGNVPVLSRPP